VTIGKIRGQRSIAGNSEGITGVPNVLETAITSGLDTHRDCYAQKLDRNLSLFSQDWTFRPEEESSNRKGKMMELC
jgi:hypothetical protein